MMIIKVVKNYERVILIIGNFPQAVMYAHIYGKRQNWKIAKFKENGPIHVDLGILWKKMDQYTWI